MSYKTDYQLNKDPEYYKITEKEATAYFQKYVQKHYIEGNAGNIAEDFAWVENSCVTPFVFKCPLFDLCKETFETDMIEKKIIDENCASVVSNHGARSVGQSSPIFSLCNRIQVLHFYIGNQARDESFLEKGIHEIGADYPVHMDEWLRFYPLLRDSIQSAGFTVEAADADWEPSPQYVEAEAQTERAREEHREWNDKMQTEALGHWNKYADKNNYATPMVLDLCKETFETDKISKEIINAQFESLMKEHVEIDPIERSPIKSIAEAFKPHPDDPPDRPKLGDEGFDIASYAKGINGVRPINIDIPEWENLYPLMQARIESCTPQ